MKFVTIREAEILAKKKINKKMFDWLQSGAEDNYTYEKNFIDLKEIQIKPYHLKKIKKIKLGTDFFGCKISSPILVAPMGHQTQFDENGEIETASGAQKENTVSFFSTQGRISLSEIRKKNKLANLGWTIFPFGNKKWILSQIKNAELNKCLAIVICIDANIRSWRYQDRESRYDARKNGRRTNPMPPNPQYALNYNWDLISYMKRNSNIPIIVKGILTKDDAINCIKKKVDGIWISNHGGRMFNSGISGVDAIVDIKKNIKNFNKVKIIIDGGVRKGSDIIKYLCLGADYVAIGRPIIHGLILDKNRGVKKILEILNDELKTSMINGGFGDKEDFNIKRLIF